MHGEHSSDWPKNLDLKFVAINYYLVNKNYYFITYFLISLCKALLPKVINVLSQAIIQPSEVQHITWDSFQFKMCKAKSSFFLIII